MGCVHEVHLLVFFWYFVERFPTVVHAKSSKLYPAQSYLCNLLRWWPGLYTRSDMGAFEELSRVTLSPKQRQVSKHCVKIMWPSRTTQISSNNAWFDGLFCRFYTYGNLPLEQHLEQISSEALSHFSRIDPKTEVPSEKHWSEPVSQIFLLSQGQ